LWSFVAGEKPRFVLSLVRRLPSYRMPVVPCSLSFLVLGVFFALAGVDLARVVLFCLFVVCFVLGVFIHESLVA